MHHVSRTPRLALATVLTLGAAVAGLVGSGSVAAQEPPPPFIWSQVIVDSVESSGVLPTINDELFPVTEGAIAGPDAFLTGVQDPSYGPNPPEDSCQLPPTTEYLGFGGVPYESVRDRRCELTPPFGDGEYFLAISPIPDDYTLTIGCDEITEMPLVNIDGKHGVIVELAAGARPSCYARIARPPQISFYYEVIGEDPDGGTYDAAALLDPIVPELFSVPGGAPVELELCLDESYPAGVDPAAVIVECSLPGTGAGTYQFGLAGVPAGMVLDQVECYDPANEDVEAFSDPAAQFEYVDTIIYCDAWYHFARQTFRVDLAVVNDDAGTADPSAFMIEVYDADGALVATQADPEPGSGNAAAEFEVPIGEYRFGFTGPAGYTGSAAITVVATGSEQIEGDGAAFVLTEDATVEAVITLDDEATATTSTSTSSTSTSSTSTSSTTATTVAVTTTTVVPATTVPPSVSPTSLAGVLPATGGPRQGVMLLSLLLLGTGLVITAAARRPRRTMS